MKLAIVGSRLFTDYNFFEECMKKYFWDNRDGYNCFRLDIDHIISGGATGADKLAKKFAMLHNRKFIEHLADWGTYAKAGGPIRNSLICREADEMVAFLGNGPGTRNAIKQMLKMGKPVLIVPVDTGVT